MNAFARLSAISTSLMIHTAIVVGLLGLHFNLPSLFRKEKIPIEVIDFTKSEPQKLNLQASKPRKAPTAPAPVQRQVFGASRNAITTNEPQLKPAEVKLGNTVAKENDQLRLSDDDASSIPIPAEQYLITSPVKLIRDAKIPFTAEARSNNIDGAVILELLIDENGKVRVVDLIRGPGYGLNEAAMKAVKDFLFKPAKIGEKFVAVKIRYTYRFNLKVQ